MYIQKHMQTKVTNFNKTGLQLENTYIPACIPVSSCTSLTAVTAIKAQKA